MPGDPACWLSQLCPECGAVPTGAGPCWRCGAAHSVDADADELAEQPPRRHSRPVAGESPDDPTG